MYWAARKMAVQKRSKHGSMRLSPSTRPWPDRFPRTRRPSTTSTYRVRRKGSRLRIPARLPIAACRYSADQQQYRGGAQRTVTVDDRYFAAQAVMVREQIKRAGVRLGAILNTALTPGYWCPASPASSEAVASDTDRNDFWEIAGRRPSGPYPCP